MRARAARLATVLLLLAACDSHDRQQSDAPTGEAPRVWVVVATGRVDRPNGRRCTLVRLRYPQLLGGGSSQVVNAAVEDVVRQVAGPWSDSCREPLPSVDYEPAAITSDFEQVRLDDRIASFRVTFSFRGYPTGAIDAVYTFNFDLATGTPITLDSLFRPGTKRAGLGVMSGVARRVLRSRSPAGHDETHLLTGTTPADYNFGAFALADGAVEVTFQPHQVTSYAAGTATVSIPALLLRPFLRPSVL